MAHPAQRNSRWHLRIVGPTAALTVCLCAAVLLAGCSSRSASAPQGPTVIKYWEKWTGFEGDAMRAVVDAFNRSQSRIRVELLTVSQIDQKMLLASAGGNPPDVAGLWSYNVNVYADKNAIIPLDGYLARAGLAARDYIPCFWDLCEYRRRVWALPTTPASLALHWNKEMFRQAGLDPERPPRTIEELDAYAEKLTRRDASGRIVQMGFIPSEPGWWNWSWGYFFGGRLWDGHSKITANSPENVRAYQWVQSYARKYGSQQIQLFQSGFGNFSSPQNAFLSGKVAMELQGVWMHNFIEKYAPGLKWGAAPFPHPADRPDLANTTIVESDVLVIPNGARHPNEAFEFMKFVNSQRGTELLNMGQRKFTPLVRVSEHFLKTHPNPYINVFIELARGRNTHAAPEMSLWTQYRDEMNAAFDDIWLCRSTPKQALDRVQKRMQKKLDRELRRLRRLGRGPYEEE